MASARKIKANQANAKASTGPKTARGKARSARNALRHGLSLPISADPNLAQEVRALALKLAGDNGSIGILQYALLVAEAQVELNRIRRARLNLLRQHVGDLGGDEMGNNSPVSKNSQAAKSSELSAESPVPEDCPGQGARTVTLNLDPAVLDQLVKIDRYERRTLSKRKFAIRNLDRARQRQLKSRKPHQQPKEVPP